MYCSQVWSLSKAGQWPQDKLLTRLPWLSDSLSLPITWHWAISNTVGTINTCFCELWYLSCSSPPGQKLFIIEVSLYLFFLPPHPNLKAFPHPLKISPWEEFRTVTLHLWYLERGNHSISILWVNKSVNEWLNDYWKRLTWISSKTLIHLSSPFLGLPLVREKAQD